MQEDLKNNFKNIQFKNGKKMPIGGYKKGKQKVRKNAKNCLEIGSKIKSRNSVHMQLS